MQIEFSVHGSQFSYQVLRNQELRTEIRDYSRRSRQLSRSILIGSEAQQGGNVSCAIQFGVVLQIKQFNVAPDRDRDDRIANVI
jgi:hypothetical protein